MRLLKLLLAGAAVGVILVAFRGAPTGAGWMPGRGRGGRDGDAEREPVLGYDGMEEETLLEWLADAEADRETLEHMHRYEALHRDREPVLAAIEERLGALSHP